MINLRYHIVSITAVFLALGIGVALGGTFLDNYTVEKLNSNISSAERRIRSTTAENTRLKRVVASNDKRDKALSVLATQTLFRGDLTGVPVLVISVDGVDKSSQDTLRATLAGAGADMRGTLSFTDKLNLDDPTAADLAKTLHLTSPSVPAVRASLVTLLAQALMTGARPATSSTSTTIPGVTTTVASTTTVATTAAPTTTAAGSPSSTSTPAAGSVSPPEPAVITALRQGGELKYQPPDGGSPDDRLFTTGRYRYVVVSGSGAVVPDASLLHPMLRTMADAGGAVPVVVASAAVGDDPDQVRSASIGPIRDDDVLRHSLSTVDDLETFSGLAATVLAIEDLGRNVHGHYGVGDGASTQLPIGP